MRPTDKVGEDAAMIGRIAGAVQRELGPGEQFRPERIGLYRALVHHAMFNTLANVFSASRAAYDAHHEAGAFEAMFRSFLAARGSVSHKLRELPTEFASWISSSAPAHFLDLARYEACLFEVACAPDVIAVGIEIAPDRPLLFAPASLLPITYAVHLLDRPATSSVTETPGALLVFRDREHSVRTEQMDTDAAEAVRRLMSREPLGSVARSVACSVNLAGLLAHLAEEGAVLGGSPD